MLRYRYEGTTDEVTTCDCCGRANLKSTVCFTDLDEGVERFFGVVCAAKMLKVTSAEVRANAKNADDAKQAAARAKQQAESDERNRRWVTFLIEATGGIYDWGRAPDIYQMIQKLGGIAAARELFNIRSVQSA
jgi:hypothetical protein